MKAAQGSALVLADCFAAILHGDPDDIADATNERVGLIRLAEFVNVMIGANTKR